MAENDSAIERAPQSRGADKAFVLELAKKPEGFLFLIAVIAEGMLLLIFSTDHSTVERLSALGGFTILFVILVVYYYRLRGRAYDLRRFELERRAVPPNMTLAAVKAERFPDLRTAVDRTFVYAEPPANWDLSETSLEEQVGTAVKQQGGDASAIVLAYRAGKAVLFKERVSHRIAFLPGKSLINGRYAFGQFNIEHHDSVGMYSVSKRGGMIRDMTAEHVFAQLLAGLVGDGVKFDVIRVAPAEVGGRTTLTGGGASKLEHVAIDGLEVASAAIEARLHVVEHANLIYVIETRLLVGTPSSEERRAEVLEIVQSFRAAKTADAAKREHEDAEEADRVYEKLMHDKAGQMLLGQGGMLLQNTEMVDGVPRVDEHMRELAGQLEAYANAFPNYVAEPDRKVIGDFRANVEAAFTGKPAALVEMIEATKPGISPPDANSPADAGQAPVG